jgi:hypothetical protein
LATLALCGALTVAARDSATLDWVNARSVNTAAAYHSFMGKHPGDAHVEDAQIEIAVLQDESSWRVTRNGNSLDSYRRYLQPMPTGTHAQVARDHLMAMERANAWRTAQSGGSKSDLEAFLQAYPHGPLADKARHVLTVLKADNQAKLGALRDARAAERVSAEVRSQFDVILKEVEGSSPDSSINQHRLISGHIDRRNAEPACHSLIPSHLTCEAVKADQQPS